MAALGAVLLFLAAIIAVVLRVAVATSDAAATPPGDLKPPVWNRQNKFVTFGAFAAIAVAILLLVSPIDKGAAVIPLLLSLFMVAVLICMAVPWPENNIGDLFFNNIWGKPLAYETDPAVDKRLDPASPDYDPAMNKMASEYDDDYFKNHALVTQRGKPYWLFAYFGAVATIVVYVIIAGVIITLSGFSLGSIGGGPSNPHAQPTAEATNSAPTPAPSSAAPSSSPENSRPPMVFNTCGEAKEWVRPLPKSKRQSFYPGGVYRCTGKGVWKLWTVEAPGFVVVTRSYRDDATNWNYSVFNWEGEDYVVAWQPDKEK